MERANLTKVSGARRLAGLAIRAQSGRRVKRLMVYAAIGISVLLPGFPKRALAQIPGAETNAGPAAAAAFSNGMDYVAWKGKNNPGYIWYATSLNNGGSWGSQQETSFQTTQAPALTAGVLAWRGPSPNPTDLVYFSINTGSWSSQQAVCSTSNCYTTAAPALAVPCGSLIGSCSGGPYIAWTTASGTIEVATYGSTWSLLPSAVMANPALNTAPALAVYDDTIFLAWVEKETGSPCGGSPCYQVMYATSPVSSISWSSPKPAGAVSNAAVPPALGIYQSALHGFGAKLSAGLYMAWYVPGGADYAWWNGSSWNAAVPVPGLPIPPGPLTPALNFTVSIPAGTCDTLTTYNFGVVYAAPASGGSYDEIYLSGLDSYQVLNKFCPPPKQ